MPKSDVTKLISSLMNTQRLIGDKIRRDEDVGFFSITQLEILRYIDVERQPLMREVAEYLKVTPPSVTFLIDPLVRAGKLRRLSDKKDRRIVRLAITAKGKRALNEGFKKIKGRVGGVFEKLNKKEINSLIKIHQKIAVILKNK
ncbi:MAG: hypothetical protein CO002_02685 [Candidatus Portnoybacteria bacterium CG_4_8_14_3_um_filter_44_10]|uniref:HTH marR-type domain-containing protein n=5 Tax=Candidatus Portnoyibacteriota TaxID=1817913 RepID=A0A2H0KPE9_9BACT|nr:MAG: hypothetical protein COV85_04285 [Candidatus Portnoybacteria bacterium CG11_big_fil_rev_8_21_14_0_20_44_10]PIS16835.1 MAG: hypothetical protein COT61_01805 [Candidatus Portnoybacteria bacterium CG09_land_8_20_14_0_10_44_13]PIW75326.1 MAG: hypothetical protein CO002_02685 [Candidatus Portnoybacteria bacterium CG_4_8_14_3_um_filter_44_10]PIZ69601.1 MAG: hypothetical protein COY11_04200 [Candidatus Portnoybacteria bacterium CG_4_10_14_0_2_um_filter_44_20]PJA63218.1 MAG: hypothetical protei